MTRWSYVGVNVSTGEVLESLPLTGVSLSRQMNGPGGSLSGTLSLAGREQATCDRLVDAVDCGRRAIYALADGVPVWGGMSWTDPDQDGESISVQAGEWGTYFARRVLRQDLGFDGADQFVIARAFIAAAQGVAGGDVGVVSDPSALSGVYRDRTYLAGDLPVITEMLAALANVENGFDYAWPVEWDPGDVTQTHLRGRLLLGYPRLGLPDDEAQYVVTLKRARGLSLDRSAGDMATTSWAVGKPAQDGDPTPMASVSDPALLAGGYPVLDKVERYQDVTTLDELLEHATADQQAAGGPLVSVSASVPLTDVLSGDVGLGDPVRVERFARRDGVDGLVVTVRCTGIDMDPAAGTAKLTLSPRVASGGRVPRRQSAALQVARLDREVRLMTVSR